MNEKFKNGFNGALFHATHFIKRDMMGCIYSSNGVQDLHIGFWWENNLESGHFQNQKNYRRRSYIEREIGNLVMRVGVG